MFFRVFVDLCEILVFSRLFKNVGVWVAKFEMIDSRLYSPQVFVKIVHLHPYVCLVGRGGLGAPGPPVEDGRFLMIPTPTKSTQLILNLQLKFKNSQK